MKSATATLKPKPDVQGARTKLLDAALRVFARDGLHRATTRIIAEEAGVNEVTLFRQFQSKDGLIAAVFERVTETNAYGDLGEEEAWAGDLRESLMRFGESFYAMLEKDEAFIRTLIGEARRHPEHYRKIIMDAIRHLRSRFIGNLEAARKNGKVRPEINLSAAVDTFTNMLMGGMLKNTASCNEGYDATTYVATCVDIFAAGLAPISTSRP